MSKKNRKNRRPQPKPAPRSPSQNPVVLDNPTDALREARAESNQVIPAGEAVKAPDDPMPPQANLELFWEIVKESRANFEAAQRKASKSETKAESLIASIDKRQKKFDEAKELLELEQADLEEQAQTQLTKVQALESQEQELTDRETKLLEMAASLKDREINAEVGFIAERKASLAAMERAVSSLREQLAETERAIAEQRVAWLRERQTESDRLHTNLEAGFREREKEIECERETLHEEHKRTQKWARRLQMEEDELAETRTDLDARVQRHIAAKKEKFLHDAQTLQISLEQARKDRDAAEQKLLEREEADRRFGQRSPEQVIEELDQLRAENSLLTSDLAARPDADAVERLRVLQDERAEWLAKRVVMERRVSDAEQRLASQQIAVTELEMLRDKKIAAESRVAVLQQARDELRVEVDQLIGRDDAKLPFPACSALDAPENQHPEDYSIDIRSLRRFVADLQQRIAYNPENLGSHLYYGLADLRCFLGGLAMGRLTLLQGISGTGKTSLPVAFARAVGSPFGDDNLIQVQAGWRDPQDLVGHYNAFEKRFYEQKFLRALYCAATPRWKDGIHIVVLDEMNLSHPEQYFSDMLSTLEQPIEKRFIELMTHGVESAPALFIDGKRLKVPENLWFVGTANHDETTKDFADKTYDRSMVMEFPHRPESFDIEPPNPRKPMSCAALQRAFSKAQDAHANEAQQVSVFLNDEIRSSLERDFKIGWGPRLEEQLKRFCPVVVAAGGTVGEAADQILAMRLLRKLKNRHDNRPNQLERLRDCIREAWPSLDRHSQPTKSDEVLRSELSRFGVDTEGEQ